jgi:MbtH protein
MASDEPQFHVVVNDEEQYSVWWAERPVPTGWRVVGVTGDRAACLTWIGAHWSDIRPLSARDTSAVHRGQQPVH